MHVYKEGYKLKGPCETCREFVSTTLRIAPLEYNGHIIPDVLHSLCDVCDTPIYIPHQSTYKIREFLKAL